MFPYSLLCVYGRHTIEELLLLARSKESPFPFCEISERDIFYTDSLEFFYIMIDCSHHTANLSVLSFCEDNREL